MTLVNRILIATDFSACSQRALEYSATMAAQFKAKVLIAHVYPSPAIVVPEAVIPMTADNLQAILDKMQAGLSEATATARKLGAAERAALAAVAVPGASHAQACHAPFWTRRNR